MSIEINNNKKLSQQLAKIATQVEAIDVTGINARINNLATLSEGSTTGDAELIDARVGSDGVIYTNVGEAIREQSSQDLFKENYKSRHLTEVRGTEVIVDFDSKKSVKIEIHGKTTLNGNGTIAPNNPFTFSSGNGHANQKITLTGSETVTTRSNTSITHSKFVLADVLAQEITSAYNLYCSHVDTNNANNADTSIDCVSSSGSVGYKKYLYFSIAKSKLETDDIAGFKKYLADQYAKGTPLTIWYVASVGSGNYSIFQIVDSENITINYGIKSKNLLLGNSCCSDGTYTQSSILQTLDSSNVNNYTITLRTNTSANYTKFVVANILSAPIKWADAIKCNRFLNGNANDAAIEGNYVCGNINYGYEKNLHFSIANTFLSDISTNAAKIASFKAFISSNPIMFYYNSLEVSQYSDGENLPLNLKGAYTIRSVDYLFPTKTTGGELSVLYDTSGALEGKKINVIGDSYVANNTLPITETWHYKLAKKYGMTYRNYGVNGNRLCPAIEGDGSLVNRYTTMDTDADYVIVCIGHNDASSGVSIDTFKENFGSLCSGLLDMYPNGKIAFVTPWNQYGNSAVSGFTPGFSAVIEAEVEIATNYGIPIFDNRKSGMYCGRSGFQALYTAGDYSHLNNDGHNLFMTKIESFSLSL